MVLMLGALVAVPPASADHGSGCDPGQGEAATAAGHHLVVEREAAVENDPYEAYPSVTATASVGLHEESNGVGGYQEGDGDDCGHGGDDPVLVLECQQPGVYVDPGVCGVGGAALP